ncbi:MAG: DEAD/DEAH box helicase [Verrucomicrobia bacterium]|nr:DEAD/DEAH box helicase [Verrucomicrobiota bacterium]
MAKAPQKGGHTTRFSAPSKYDANNTVLDKTYGAFADLRRELSDTKAAVAVRSELLNHFANCSDPQRAWLFLDDYLEKLRLSRKDFAAGEWWQKLLTTAGKSRLEETALLFLRSGRPVPQELHAYANYNRLAELQQAEQDEVVVKELENWLIPRASQTLDGPRASLRVVCRLEPVEGKVAIHRLEVEFSVTRLRTGEKVKGLPEMIELHQHAATEQHQFSPEDWEFIQWLSQWPAHARKGQQRLHLTGAELLAWMAQWGSKRRLELVGAGEPLSFHGEVIELAPHLEELDAELALTNHYLLPDGEARTFQDGKLFDGLPRLVMLGTHFYLLRNPPTEAFVAKWTENSVIPVRKLSHRLLTHLRRHGHPLAGDWEQLCNAHKAKPEFTFELADEVIRLRLRARSERDGSVWQWDGHEWQIAGGNQRTSDKPEVLDDPRLEPAVGWLRKSADWFTPEPGLWVGDANGHFLNLLAAALASRPKDADFLGNPAFQRLFIHSRKVRPKLVLNSGGSGIDWFTVSAEWETEGMRLTAADLKALAGATGRFVKLPDSGWIELDSDAVHAAHEAMADLGLEGLSANPQKVSVMSAMNLDEATFARFADQPAAKALRERIRTFDGIPDLELPAGIQAEMRPYQKEGFNFLCHLASMGMGGVLADDMGLGKTLQTLSWLAHLVAKNGKDRKPSLVVCPASVLHNWRREAEKFTPHLKVLVLESGSARHNLRKQIPQHDIVVTNYALLRRDLDALKKFPFRALILDEAQFIKNPQAQVTQCVKELEAGHRLALTGTPLENRLLDLWSIVDFAVPGYLGTQADFLEIYEPKGEDAAWASKIARRRLSAKLRPLMLRRLKKQVAKDLPERIEERRDCDLGEAQRKLYLAELRRSREQIQKAVETDGLAKSKMHVLAALTRLRQICCHPQLVGNDSASGKTDTLFELLETLSADGQKVLVFSQFVQMLKLLEAECKVRQIPTYLLSGETKNRQEVMQSFQDDPNAAIFLLSLRAAGTGLNLTTASTVVLYDPWWNPAVEAQAIDRSHRIGQTRTVFAYRLIAPGTVEEKIWDLQQRKAQTIADVLGEEGFARSLTKADLEYLFSED